MGKRVHRVDRGARSGQVTGVQALEGFSVLTATYISLSIYNRGCILCLSVLLCLLASNAIGNVILCVILHIISAG